MGDLRGSHAVQLPHTFDDLCRELTALLEIPRDDVARRLWREALNFGSNVCDDVRRFGVTPHVYDAAMERLYQEGDGFIFESTVFWLREGRARWTEVAAERLQRLGDKRTLRILMFGDGAGSDSIWLAQNGFQVEYCDFPGSRTSDFARKRFEHYGVLGDGVECIPASAVAPETYDAVISFEVLEHLPDPPATVRLFAEYLRHGGIALVSDDFDNLIPQLPTHLRSNRRYALQTPSLFMQNGMSLSWYNRAAQAFCKPWEFVKRRPTVNDRIKTLVDPVLVRSRIMMRLRHAKENLLGSG